MKYIAIITSIITSFISQTYPALSLGQKNIPSEKETSATSEAEHRQRLISRVLQKSSVQKELFGTYKSALVRIANKNSDVQIWLEDMDQYLDSKDFQNHQANLKEEELAQNRILIEMTIKQLS